MKTQYNLEEFFKIKAEEHLPSPPKEIWDKINNVLVKENLTTTNPVKNILTNKIFLSSVIFCVVTTSVITYNFYNKKSKNPRIYNANNNIEYKYIKTSNTLNNEKKTPITPPKKEITTNQTKTNNSNIEIKNPSKKRMPMANNTIEEKTNITTNYNNTNVNNDINNINNNEINLPKKNYLLNASEYSQVTKIEIIANDKTFITIDNPPIFNDQIDIDISKLKKGTYDIKIQTDKGIIFKKLNVK